MRRARVALATLAMACGALGDSTADYAADLDDDALPGGTRVAATLETELAAFLFRDESDDAREARHTTPSPPPSALDTEIATVSAEPHDLAAGLAAFLAPARVAYPPPQHDLDRAFPENEGEDTAETLEAFLLSSLTSPPPPSPPPQPPDPSPPPPSGPPPPPPQPPPPPPPPPHALDEDPRRRKRQKANPPPSSGPARGESGRRRRLRRRRALSHPPPPSAPPAPRPPPPGTPPSPPWWESEGESPRRRRRRYPRGHRCTCRGSRRARRRRAARGARRAPPELASEFAVIRGDKDHSRGYSGDTSGDGSRVRRRCFVGIARPVVAKRVDAPGTSRHRRRRARPVTAGRRRRRRRRPSPSPRRARRRRRRRPRRLHGSRSA